MDHNNNNLPKKNGVLPESAKSAAKSDELPIFRKNGVLPESAKSAAKSDELPIFRKNGVLPESAQSAAKSDELPIFRRNGVIPDRDLRSDALRSATARLAAAAKAAKSDANRKYGMIGEPQDGIHDPNWLPSFFFEELAANGVCALKKRQYMIHRNERDETMYNYMRVAYAKWAAPHRAIFNELDRIATAIDTMVTRFGMHEMDKMPQDEASKEERFQYHEDLLKAMAEAFKQFGVAGDGIRLRELHVIYSHMMNDANPAMLAVKAYMEGGRAQMESGECLVNRCRWLMSSAMDCVKMATEQEWRRQLFDCSGALRNAITLLRRELGWTVREEYCRKFYTLPAIAYCYLRKMRGECICTEGCKPVDSE